MGNDEFRRLIMAIISSQYELCKEFNFPLTGNFISYRGSMINWCPIGRSAKDTDRKAWAKIDIDNRIRSKELLVLASKLKETKVENIVIKLGGETSFDIYPQGWDKTYAFRAFENFEDIYFVGDRCKPNGNDYEAYKMAGNKGYETTGPERTIEIIGEILKRGSS
jgi:phosphomannomutase